MCPPSISFLLDTNYCTYINACLIYLEMSYLVNLTLE